MILATVSRTASRVPSRPPHEPSRSSRWSEASSPTSSASRASGTAKNSPSLDRVVIVGAGAAGLATAIFLRRLKPSTSVVLLEGARRPGAKILVSGGSRCNVTNAVVTAADFHGGPAAAIRRVLRALPVRETLSFFAGLGVTLREEADGKLFPTSNRSRDVLDALLREVAARGASLETGTRVEAVARTPTGFSVSTSRGPFAARALVLATGGRSLPKSGSDGAGYDFARALGHAIVPTTPALVPLLLADASIHARVAGVSHEVEIAIWIDGAIAERLRGALLWTHVGISGPAALNASRHWLRAELDGRRVRATASFAPGSTFDALDRRWTASAADRPKALVQTLLATMVPASLAALVMERLGIDGATPLAHFPREQRRRLVRALVEWPLAVTGSRGYAYAEATAGGVALTEIDPATMESRVCPGLFLVGEILDVDGRIGGFNFQWAWSTAFVAARALARRQS